MYLVGFIIRIYHDARSLGRHRRINNYGALVELYCSGKNELTCEKKNLWQWHFVYYSSHMQRPGIEPGHPHCSAFRIFSDFFAKILYHNVKVSVTKSTSITQFYYFLKLFSKKCSF